MPDTFRWPPEPSDFEAMNLDLEPVVPATPRSLTVVAQPLLDEEAQAEPQHVEPTRGFQVAADQSSDVTEPIEVLDSIPRIQLVGAPAPIQPPDEVAPMVAPDAIARINVLRASTPIEDALVGDDLFEDTQVAHDSFEDAPVIDVVAVKVPRDEPTSKRVWSELRGNKPLLALGLLALMETGWLIARPFVGASRTVDRPALAADQRRVTTEAPNQSNPQNAAAHSGDAGGAPTMAERPPAAVERPDSKPASAPVPAAPTAPAPVSTSSANLPRASQASTSQTPTGQTAPTVSPASPPRASQALTSQLPASQTASTLSPVASRAAAAPALGWVTIPLSFQVQVYENGRFVGTNDTNQIPLAAGRHDLQLVNESLRYNASYGVDIPSGKTATLTVNLPSGTLHLNALPWAEVLIDGQSVGQTPLANLKIPIGPHQIVFRHPDLGEQTRSVIVGVDSTARLGIDFAKH